MLVGVENENGFDFNVLCSKPCNYYWSSAPAAGVNMRVKCVLVLPELCKYACKMGPRAPELCKYACKMSPRAPELRK